MSDRKVSPTPYPTVAPAPLPTPDTGSRSQPFSWSRGPVAASRDVASGAGAYTSLGHYIAPTERKIFDFKDGDYYTDKMKKHPAVEQTRESLRGALGDACRLDCEPNFGSGSTKVKHDLGELSLWGRAWDFTKTIAGVATFGLIGHDPDYGTVGSFSSKSKVRTTDIDCEEGSADAKFSIANRMGMGSNTRFDYDPTRESNTILSDDPLGETGSFGTVKQSWEWNERITFEANTECPSPTKRDAVE
jgi:hypothetical protein